MNASFDGVSNLKDAERDLVRRWRVELKEEQPRRRPLSNVSPHAFRLRFRAGRLLRGKPNGPSSAAGASTHGPLFTWARESAQLAALREFNQLAESSSRLGFPPLLAWLHSRHFKAANLAALQASTHVAITETNVRISDLRIQVGKGEIKR